MISTYQNLFKEFKIIILLLLFSIIISRLLFFFSGYILEDSFIVFRSTFNYSDFGIYSFNLDEQHTGVTSKIFGLVCTLFRALFNDFAILAIVAFNTFLSLIACLVFYYSSQKFIIKEIDFFKKLFLLFIIFFNPAIFIIGVTGLEYSLVILFISFHFFYITSAKNNYIVLLFCALLPATRFELVAVNLIFIFLFFIFNNKKWIFFNIFFNFWCSNKFLFKYVLYDGSLFPSSAISKWATLSKTDHTDLKNLFDYFSIWFLTSKSFFTSVTSKFIPNFIYCISAIIILILLIINFKYINIFKYTNIDQNYKIFILGLTLNIIFVPLAYVLAGHAFPWYFFPFSFLFYLFIAIIFLNSSIYNKIYVSTFLISIIFLSSFQFLLLKNIGFQENVYRANVGQYISEISNKEDTLFLEPAGYIPFFSKIKTYDTVGLTSPLIKKYRKKDKIKNWWFNFVYQEKPTYVVDRRDVMVNGNVRDGGYMLNFEELEWFRSNYKKIREFKYKDYVEKYGGGFKSFYKLGSHSDYYVFKLIKN